MATSAIFFSFSRSSVFSDVWRFNLDEVGRSVVPALISLRRLSMMFVSSTGESGGAFAPFFFFLASSAARFASSRLRRFSSKITR